jgi:hypothetical protein
VKNETYRNIWRLNFVTRRGVSIVKKLVCTFALIGMITLGSTSYAAEPITIMVNNKQIQSDVAPILEKGRVLVPLRVVAESLSATVAWDQKTKTATVSKWSERIKLTVGQKKAFIDGRLNSSCEISLDVSVKIVNNRVYVPLRFFAQEFGYKVAWKYNAVSINSPLDNDQRTTLYKGNLIAAREIARAAVFGAHYEHTPLMTSHHHEEYSDTYLFPEGEALRFYVIDSSETVSLYEFKDDFLVATWQAHIDEGNGDAIKLFMENTLKDKTGPTPKINKTFLYYRSGMSGDSSYESGGTIDLDGKITETGSKRTIGGEVTQSTGTMALSLPDEIRKEFVKIP